MSLVEEEDQLREREVADLWERRVEFGEEPHEERRVEFRLHHELVGGEDIHDSLAVLSSEEVVDVEGWEAEELVGALVLELEDSALDSAYALRGDGAVGRLNLLGVLGEEVEESTEVLDIVGEEALFVDDSEEDIEDASLRLVETEEAAKEEWPHAADSSADRVALSSVDVEEADWAGLEVDVGDAEFRFSLLDKTGGASDLADAGEVAFHIGHKAWDTSLAERLGEDL